MTATHRDQYLAAFQTSIQDGSFVSLSLGNYQGIEPGLKNIYVKKALIKRQEMLSFTYRRKTNDVVKNFDPKEGFEQITQWIGNDFLVSNLFTSQFNLQFEVLKSGKSVLRQSAATQTNAAAGSHDKIKNRPIAATKKTYLSELKITDETGHVFHNAQDKYRQINHYIDILQPLITQLPEDKTLHVADMGSGKGYLTFALYDYLTNVLKRQAAVKGIEYRDDLVDLCNTIAAKSGFDGLHFEQGTIDDFDSTGTNVLIALHACDTATDDAIAKGIRAGSDLIVVAPCCHKQIRREMEKNKTHNDVEFLTRYGIFMERQAEMVTDGIRALILEYHGYRTKVFQFVSDVHTPKNVMITGQKLPKAQLHDPRILKKIEDTKAYFGITYHHLERLLSVGNS